MDDPTITTGTTREGTAKLDDPAASADDGGRAATSREWLAQLQAMIDNLATTAAPVMREIGAKAAELAAAAGERAGPIAQKAAEVTAQAGTKVAERGREVAAELRRDQPAGNGTADPDRIAIEPPAAPADATAAATSERPE